MRKNTEISKILPAEVKEKYNCIKIQSKYVNVISIVSMEEIVLLELLDILLLQKEITVSFHINRQDSMEFLKKITRCLAENGAEIRSINKNQLDIEVLEKNKNDAVKIKKEIQVNNENVYLVEVYIKVIGASENEVLSRSNNIKNILYTRGIILSPTYFKQKFGYIASLPLLQTNKTLSDYTENIMLTTGLAKLFPFFDKDNLSGQGIYIGKHENKYIKLSLLDKRNLNHNMCVFGSSGVGKSFFIKLLIMRNFYNGINQIIIDPEGEYKNIVLSLGGNVYELETYDPMWIEEKVAINNSDFLEQSIKLVSEYLFYNYGLRNVENEIRNMYLEYGVTKDIESLYEKSTADKIYVLPKYRMDFPRIKSVLSKFGIENNLVTNTKPPNKSKLNCFIIKGSTKDKINKEIMTFLPKIKQLIEENTLIYFDEIWKTIKANNDGILIEEIYNFFKTLRKRKAGIVAISQDIGDLFVIDEGNFGKSILNNSYTKVFFKMTYTDFERIKGLDEITELSEKVTKLSRGETYIMQGENKFIVDIEANAFEKELIEREDIYEESFNSNG